MFQRITLSVILLVLSSITVAAQPPVVQLMERNSLKGWSIQSQTSQLRGYDIATGDIDGDGDEDFVVAADAGLLVYVNAHAAIGSGPTANEAYGTFRLESVTRVIGYPPSIPADAVALADLDNDGDLDLIVGFNSVTPMKVYQNNGSGIFNLLNNVPSVNEKITSIAVGDVDGDGDLDILWGAQPMVQGPVWVGGQSHLFLNDGFSGGSWLQNFTDATATNLPTASFFTKDVGLADMNGDGDLDIVLANQSFSLFGFVRSGQNQYYDNSGAGVFTSAPTRIYSIGAGVEYTTGIALADVDGDSDIDLVMCNYNSPTAFTSKVYLNDLTTAGAGWSLTASVPLNGNTRFNQDVAVGDIDLDGDLDIVFGNDRFGFGQPSDGDESVFVNTGGTPVTFTRSFLPPANNQDDRISATDRQTGTIALADLDRDGDLDVITGDTVTNQPEIYVNLHRQISAPATVTINSSLDVDLYAQPGYGGSFDGVSLILSGGTTVPRVQIPNLEFLGFLGVNLSVVFTYPSAGVVHARSAFTISLPIPNDPTLRGAILYHQAIYNGQSSVISTVSRFSNVTRTVIQ